VPKIILILLILSTTVSPSTEDIEMSFLQNNARMLYRLFSSTGSITISLPEPISYSDQLSHQQAYFLWKNIFSDYLTFEFYSEEEFPLTSEEKNLILKARWSFKNKKTNNQYVFHVFFYLMKDSDQKKKLPKSTWQITEIKAEKI